MPAEGGGGTFPNVLYLVEFWKASIIRTAFFGIGSVFIVRRASSFICLFVSNQGLMTSPTEPLLARDSSACQLTLGCKPNNNARVGPDEHGCR